MQIILRKSLDIFDHLATEEYLLREQKDEFLMIWRSSPTVVVGKHQNLYAETNFPYIHRSNITLARRISGGGTVYHDPGNINFTFIKNGEEGKLIDFGKQTQPIIHFLNHLETNAYLGKRNNIFIDGLKVSGNAEHIYKNRILHHGTLLFSSNLEELARTLVTREQKYSDKAVKSVKARVTNINTYLEHPMTTGQFMEALAASFQYAGTAGGFYEPNAQAKQNIDDLKCSKYMTKEWIFGYSPKYCFTNYYRIGDTKISFRLYTEKGIITTVESANKALTKALTGLPHRFEDVKNRIKTLYPSKNEVVLDDITYAFFY